MGCVRYGDFLACDRKILDAPTGEWCPSSPIALRRRGHPSAHCLAAVVDRFAAEEEGLGVIQRSGSWSPAMVGEGQV